MTSFEDKVKGVLISTALGDALGAPVEKLSYQEIKEMYGRVESLDTKWYKQDLTFRENKGRSRGNGIITDDTLMTLALCNVYITEQRHIDAYDMADEFVKEIYYYEKYIPELKRVGTIMDRLFLPEQHIFLRHALANCEPREGGQGNMVNCGAAMYISPVGIINAGNPKAAYDEAILFAMGHQVSYGLEAAGVLAACVAKALEENATIDDVVDVAIEVAKDGTKEAIKAIVEVARKFKNESYERLVSEFQKAILPYSPMGDDVSRSIDKVGKASNHYIPNRNGSIEELPFALGFIIYNDGEYYKSMYDGINSGRDTDSIGVMIGVILGAMYGASVIKPEDKSLLEETNHIDFDKISDELTTVAMKIIKEDIDTTKRMEQFIKGSID